MGLSTSVADARFAKPLDEDLIALLAREHEVLITIEEGAVINGFGAHMARELSTLASEHAIDVRCLGLPDQFVQHGGRDELLRELGLDAEGIATEARRMLGDALPAAMESA